ncbi:hypothetical protein KFE25_005103 [Diacronema lutheri]|uniref:Ankyrin repeat protein n=1 Tax=Diacronema lutheri TaxID=2081491 RepID=A0A8J5X923_DIALT|nr:hypothetical protein KFE25_005103 [Diacronema lutheri]
MTHRGRSLHGACATGRLGEALGLLRDGADVDQTNDEDLTPLMLASTEGHAHCVRALLGAAADVNRATEEHGSTALMLASIGGHVECLRVLLGGGAAANQSKMQGVTALMLATYTGHAACVSTLLAGRAAANQAKEDGTTALMLASSHGRADCVRALLDGAADVDLAMRLNGWTALMLASSEGHAECAHALLSLGAAVDRAEADGMTALMLASLEGHVECARVLLEGGANVHLVDSLTGHSALVLGCEHLCIVQLLCAYGARRDELLAPDGGALLHDLPDECRAWLFATRRFTSELHHVEFLPVERVRALVVGGADLHVRGGGGGDSGAVADAPTPLEIARALLARGLKAHDGAQLVVDAAALWSPRTNKLFPARARARAVELLLFGHALTRQARLARDGIALLDAWELVMAHAVCR